MAMFLRCLQAFRMCRDKILYSQIGNKMASRYQVILNGFFVAWWCTQSTMLNIFKNHFLQKKKTIGFSKRRNNH